MKNIKSVLIVFLIVFFILPGCSNKNLDPNRPLGAEGKRKKNIEEGRGASITNILKVLEVLITNSVALIRYGGQH